MDAAAETFDMRDEKDIADAVRAANARATSLAIVGAASKARLGRHAPQSQTLSMRMVSGVTLYEPDELVLGARAGTRLREIEELLDANGQQLAFEPMDYATLLGGASRSGTIGGAIAVNASGPRRIKAGAARDHLLGFACVTGRGEAVKCGGRVMKNVTGYDLSKLVCGSFGTLAALTEVTLKVLPRAETEETLLLLGLDEAQSLAQLRRALATPCEVSSLAMTPASVAPQFGVNAAALRIEGPEISVATRRADLIMRLKESGAAFDVLKRQDSSAFWVALRDVAPLAPLAGAIWKLSVAPTSGFAVVEAIRNAGAPVLAHYYDWAGGLIWLCVEAAPDAHAAMIRAAVDMHGGHATLIRASNDTRARVEVFHPQPAPLAALSRRVKESFDPAHVLERGRMRAEY